MRELSETDVSIMPDREFKTMIINILTGLEKTVRDLNNTLNTEIKNNRAKIKGSYMRNTLME